MHYSMHVARQATWGTVDGDARQLAMPHRLLALLQLARVST